MDAKHGKTKDKSKSPAASGIYWQKVKAEAVEVDAGMFKNKKAISRNSNLSSVSCSDKTERDLKTANSHAPRRPNTAVGFEDYFDDTESAIRLKSLNTKASLQELKKSMLLHKNGLPRNCVSALGEYHGGKGTNREKLSSRPKSEEKSDDLDLTEKIRAFRALVAPKSRASRHDISNEQLKKSKSFTQGVEDVGNHVKFSSESSDFSQIRTNAPTRLLNEFQITYKQDRERLREVSGQKSVEGWNHGTEVTFNDSEVLAGGGSFYQEGISGSRGGNGKSPFPHRQLDEFQLTYEEDKLRNRFSHGSDLNRLYPHYRSERGDVMSQQGKIDHDLPIHRSHTSPQGSSSTKHAKRIIRRPGISAIPGEGTDGHSDFANQSAHQRLSGTSYDADKEVSRYTKPVSALEHHSYSGTGRDVTFKSDTQFTNRSAAGESMANGVQTSFSRRAYSATPSHNTHQDITSRPSEQVVRSNSVAGLEVSKYHQSRCSSSDRSHSVTPTLGNVHSNLGPSSVSSSVASARGILEPGASLKTHLNVLGASLSSLSSKLNSGSESDIRSLAGESGHSAVSSTSVLSSVKTGRRDDLMMSSDPKLRQQGRSPFDVNGVRVRLRDRHHLQTWSSTSDVREEDIRGNSNASQKNSVSGSVTLGSERSSILEVHDDSKQTNVHVCDSDEEGNSSRMSGNRSIRVESPRQTNLNPESKTSPLKEKRKEKLKKIVKYISRHKDTLAKFRTENKQSGIGAKEFRSKQTRKGRPTECSDAFESDSETIDDESDDVDITDDENERHAQRKRVSQERGKGVDGLISNSHHSSSGRVISRKIPLKAAHPTSPVKENDIKTNSRNVSYDQNVISRGAKKEKSRHDRLSHIQQSQSRNNVQGNEEMRKILAKRPDGRHTEKYSSRNTGGEVDHLRTQLSDRQTFRSQSALGLSSSNSDIKPSHLKSKVGEVRAQRRSQSSLDNLNSGGKRYSSKKRGDDSKSLSKACSVDDLLCQNNKGAQLKEKVKRLHQEVNQRLGSRENVAHNASTYEIHDSDCEGGSDEDVSNASTVINSGSDVDDNQEVHVKKVDENSSLFATSTPLKSKSREIKSHERGNAKEKAGTGKTRKKGNRNFATSSDDEEEENNAGIRNCGKKQSSKHYLAQNVKRVIEEKKRLTPDFINLWSCKTGRDDEDMDKDEFDPSPRQRSGSIGSWELFETNKKDILSRILSKMSSPPLNGSGSSSTSSFTYHNWHQKGNKWTFEQNGVSLPGRASPAETLLSHLDNPNMIKLLQKLYKAVPETRLKIMIKVEFFKAWQHYAVSSREQRKKKDALTQSAKAFCVHRLLLYHFVTWERRATHNDNMRRANAMFRCHMLSKGFKALKWSISQSRHQSQKLQAKVQGFMLKVTFCKWRTKTETQRRERMMKAMKRWKQFVTAAQKIRHMQQVMDINVMSEVFRCWRKRYNKRMKLNMAFSFLRVMLLKHSMSTWRGFVAQCKEKKETFAIAVLQQQHKLLQSTFFMMVVSYKKSRKAKTHFRHHKLNEVFWAWKKASQICRAERQNDMTISREHWEKQKVKHCFIHWQEILKISRAGKKADFNICKSAFVLWRQAWLTTISQREAVESTLLRNKLHRALLTWRQNVVQLKRRHKMVVALIENCHLKQTLRRWRLYTAARGILKKKALLHRIAHQRKILVTSFSQWQELFRCHREQEQAKQLWSQACARKLAGHWILICRKRSLMRLLEATDPARGHRLMKVLFTCWVQALERQNKEKEKADDLQKAFERRKLHSRFQYWRAETHRFLIVKPMVLQRDIQCVTNCFQDWHRYVLQKSKCRRNKALLQLEMLRKSFSSWRRQYQVCQVEKQIKSQISHGLVLCYLEEWQFLILRKKKSQDFRNRQLVQKMFHFWQNRAAVQVTYRARMEEEQKNNLEMMRWCFTNWWENVQSQLSWTDGCVGQFVYRQNDVKLRIAFVTWRRHMHSTLIARAYQKTQGQRLLLTLFHAWHDLTNHSVTDAVNKFSERIGLIDDTARVRSSGIGSIDDTFDETDVDRSLMSSWNSSTFSIASSTRRLFGEDDQNVEMDADRMMLLSGGLQAAVDHHQARCQRLKNSRMLRSSLESLRVYKNHRKYVKCLAQKASDHRMLSVFSKYFPPWLQKTQDQRQEKHILHLWTSPTAREMELLPIENQVNKKFGQKSMRLCFSIWLVKYRGITKIRRVYSGSLLHWVFSAWKEWALERHQLKVQSQDYLGKRQTRMAFYMWCERLRQSRETERRYHQAWQNYLILIIQQWRIWTMASRRLHHCQKVFEVQHSQRKLKSLFSRWKMLMMKVVEIRSNQTQKLMYSVFTAWRLKVLQINSEKHKVLKFQVHSYTLLVKRLFQQWHDLFTERKKQQEEQRQHAKQCALNMARVWRRKAQKTRGLTLQTHLQRGQMAFYFEHWRTSLSNLQILYDKLAQWTQKKSTGLIQQYLRIWRIQLLVRHARKVYMTKVLFTYLAEWRNIAKISKERRIRGLALKKALQERSLHVYFQYWVGMTRVKQSVQQNVETRLQIRILRSWRDYTQNMCHLRELQGHLTRKVNTRILHDALTNLRWRWEYCTSLQEIVNKIVKDRDRATMKAAMVVWKDRLDKILAARHYGQLLAVRVTRRWHKFVHKRKLRRQTDKENWEMAVKFHQRKICQKVFAALQVEVRVSNLAEKRKQRICDKFARLWKTKVDMTVTAAVLESEFVQRKMWKKWRVAFTKIDSSKNVVKKLDDHMLSQVFHGWRKLCRKQSSRIRSQAFTLDRRLSSSSSSSPSSPSQPPVPVHQARSSLPGAEMSFGFKGGRRT